MCMQFERGELQQLEAELFASPSDRAHRTLWYGQNEMRLPVKGLHALITEEVLQPLYVFQVGWDPCVLIMPFPLCFGVRRIWIRACRPGGIHLAATGIDCRHVSSRRALHSREASVSMIQVSLVASLQCEAVLISKHGFRVTTRPISSDAP